MLRRAAPRGRGACVGARRENGAKMRCWAPRLCRLVLAFEMGAALVEIPLGFSACGEIWLCLECIARAGRFDWILRSPLRGSRGCPFLAPSLSRRREVPRRPQRLPRAFIHATARVLTRAAALRRYLSTMFQGSSKASHRRRRRGRRRRRRRRQGPSPRRCAAPPAAAPRPVLQRPIHAPRLRIPESLLPRELRGAADAEGLVACDVAVGDGLIDEVAAPKSLRGIDCGGCLVVACFADSHTHLVKTHAHPRARATRLAR